MPHRWNVVVSPRFDEVADELDELVEIEHDGVYINNFNGGEENELVLSVFIDGEERDLEVYRTRPALPDFQTSELRVSAVELATGEERHLRITPALSNQYSVEARTYRRDKSGWVSFGYDSPRRVITAGS